MVRKLTQCAYVGVIGRADQTPRQCRNGRRGYRQGEREHTHCNAHQREEQEAARG